ncbi:hypothetical protein NQ314_021399 [Rhamnusium bicolor]|uniref:Nuclease HARBI1 n=1 Tax=Rhamnusium bicolor TaxID=1586634 RepID=A0AAV8WJ92_9CUCU|nr:hypothetical protein NQ314_021399 [Rhamnusium bicolor]
MDNFNWDDIIDDDFDLLEIIDFGFPRNQSVSPMNHLLTCLRFYSSGSFLMTVGDVAKVHTSTVSRIVVKVTEAIARLSDRYIKMPNNNEIEQTQRDFFQIAAFPRVIGAIDGTHVLMESPG